MARRKSSPLEDIFQLGTLLPWWVSLPLAAVIYFFLHHYAQVEIPKSTGQDIAGPMVATVIKTAAAFGQYLVPGLLVVGAVVGLISKGVRKLRYDRVVADKSGARLDNLTWLQFEELVQQYFVERKFKVTESREGADGGVDLRLGKDGRTATVQCKHWHDRKVGVTVVREQFGIMTAEQADECFVVTSGRFTDEAKRWAADKPIGLIDGRQLKHLLGHVDYSRMMIEDVRPSSGEGSSTCPRCGSRMVLRTARKGKRSGSKFWGCSSYPRCRQTFDVRP